MMKVIFGLLVLIPIVLKGEAKGKESKEINFYSLEMPAFSNNAVSDFNPDRSAKLYRLPEQKYKDRISAHKKTKNSIAQRVALASILFSFHQTSFLNPRFAYNLDREKINKKFGSSLQFRLEHLYPVTFDAIWFSSRFGFNGDYWSDPLAETPHLRHRGLEFSSNVNLLPGNQYFSLYTGVGYQTASLIASKYLPMDTFGDDNKKNAENQVQYYSDCSMGIWKVGINLGHPVLYVNAEFKQSLSMKNLKSFNQISVGIGRRLNK